MNKENYLKNEQSKSNTNDATLSNTNLFGQASLNVNKTTNNNINNINDNLLVVNGEEKNSDKLYENNLILEIITSWNLPEGYKLIIRNKHGLENSLIKRKLKQNEIEEERNVVYFGFQREEDLNTNPNIDYLLYPKEDFYDNKFIGKHFQIRYDNDNKLYYIKDLGFGFGTFIKLTKDMKIKDNFLINIGETYIVFKLSDNNTMNIKIFSGNEKYEPYVFKYNINKPILIGRDCDCDISIEDKRLSRFHCNINYDINNNIWLLKDGNKNSKSTNGTWLYAAENYQIYDGMIFKTNHNLFKCKYKFVEI
jgi:hypothetical protein